MCDESPAPREFDWDVFAVRDPQPVQVEIIEALRRIDRPLSTFDLFRVFDGEVQQARIKYHLQRLHKVKAIRVAKFVRSRGARVRLFRVIEPTEA